MIHYVIDKENKTIMLKFEDLEHMLFFLHAMNNELERELERQR